MKKLIITLISTSLVLIFLIMFIEEVDTKNKIESNELKYSISTIPNDFKVVGDLDKRVQDIVVATSRGLVELNKDNEIKPSLAESVDIKDDGLEYDFKIRNDIYWSDGTKITSKDIATFFREILTEEKEENIFALLNVYGAKSFRDGEGSFYENVGISYDQNNIIFRLNSKDDKFLEELTTPQYRLRKNVLLWNNLINNYKSLIYSGNYSIKEINDSYVELKKNNMSSESLVENISFIEDDSEEMAMAAFEVGDRDIVVNPPKSQLGRLNTEERLITLKSSKGIYLGFNPKNSQLDIKQRKNIYRIINEALEEYQLKNTMYLELAEGSYFREDKEDLTKLQSRKVMSMNEEEWSKPKEVHLVVEDNGENKDICNYLVEWFEEKENIYLSYDLLNKNDFNIINEDNYYDIAIIEGDLISSNEDSIYDKIQFFMDNDKKQILINGKTEGERLNLLNEIEEELFNNYIVLPLAFLNENIALNKNIENITLDGNGNIDFNIIEKD